MPGLLNESRFSEKSDSKKAFTKFGEIQNSHVAFRNDAMVTGRLVLAGYGAYENSYRCRYSHFT